MSTIGALLLAFVALLLYFVPAVVAFGRRHHQRAAITALNALLGWTFLGWAIAFVWAFTRVNPDNAPSGPATPHG